MEFYSSSIKEITGVKRLRLFQWIEKGYLKPSIQHSQGSGSKNIFSREDVYKIEFFKRLVENGIHRDLAAKFINFDFEGLYTLKTGVPDLKKAKRFSSETKYEFFIYAWNYPENKHWYFSGVYFADIKDTLTKYLEWVLPDSDGIFMINIKKLMLEVDEKIKKVMD